MLPGLGDCFVLTLQRRGLANPGCDLLNRLRLCSGEVDRSVALTEGFQYLDLKEQLSRGVDRPLTGIARFRGVIPYAAKKPKQFASKGV